MISAQNPKYVVGLAPISLNSTGATPLTCDTLGYSYALCVCTLGVVGGAATVWQVQESATDFSGAAITALTGAGSTGVLRLPQTADAGKTFAYGIQLGGLRKRYLQMVITTGATTLVCVQWQLFRADQVPNTDAERGLAASIFIGNGQA
jgi:hypothetical protein